MRNDRTLKAYFSLGNIEPGRLAGLLKPAKKATGKKVGEMYLLEDLAEG